MTKVWIAAGTALALAAGPAVAQQKTIRIGLISTFTGPPAAIGNDMKNSFELGLDHHGRKLGGLPVEVIYADDQTKPEIGVQKTQELIDSNHVDFVVGYIWSNVLLASLKPLVDSKTMTVVTNAGASQFAGEICSPACSRRLRARSSDRSSRAGLTSSIFPQSCRRLGRQSLMQSLHFIRAAQACSSSRNMSRPA